MLDQPSMIKRPVLELGGKLVVGFKPDIYKAEVGGQEVDARRAAQAAPSRGTSLHRMLGDASCNSADGQNLCSERRCPKLA